MLCSCVTGVVIVAVGRLWKGRAMPVSDERAVLENNGWTSPHKLIHDADQLRCQREWMLLCVGVLLSAPALLIGVLSVTVGC